jgi:hypothetical protein
MRFEFEWLRCNARGKRCRPINGASDARYRLRGRDVGRRVRARVSAENAAGSRARRTTKSKKIRAARR